MSVQGGADRHYSLFARLHRKRAQGGRGMEGAGADLHVVGLQDHAAVVRPIALQCQDQSLERALETHVGGEMVAHVSAGDAPGE
jgi:hypothetical protein